MGDLKKIGAPAVEGILVQPNSATSMAFKNMDACATAGAVLTSSTEQKSPGGTHFKRVLDSQTTEVQCIGSDGKVSVVRDGKVKVSSDPRTMAKMHP